MPCFSIFKNGVMHGLQEPKSRQKSLTKEKHHTKRKSVAAERDALLGMAEAYWKAGDKQTSLRCYDEALVLVTIPAITSNQPTENLVWHANLHGIYRVCGMNVVCRRTGKGRHRDAGHDLHRKRLRFAVYWRVSRCSRCKAQCFHLLAFLPVVIWLLYVHTYKNICALQQYKNSQRACWTRKRHKSDQKKT
jgi:hypothetical protein